MRGAFCETATVSHHQVIAARIRSLRKKLRCYAHTPREVANLELPIEVVDIDAHSDVAIEYGIRSVPTLILMDGNTEVKRLSGSKSVNELQEWAAV